MTILKRGKKGKCKWIKDNCFKKYNSCFIYICTVLWKSLEPSLISFCFASKVMIYLFLFFCNFFLKRSSAPGFLKAFQGFYLDMG